MRKRSNARISLVVEVATGEAPLDRHGDRKLSRLADSRSNERSECPGTAVKGTTILDERKNDSTSRYSKIVEGKKVLAEDLGSVDS